MNNSKSFDVVVDENLSYMIHELVRGTKWRTIVFAIMDRTLQWKEEPFTAKNETIASLFPSGTITDNRIRNIMKRVGINDAQELACKSIRELRSIRNLGTKSLNRIKAVMLDRGLTLRELQ